MECNLFEETQRNKLSDSCALPRFFQQNLCWWPIFCAWLSEPSTCSSSCEVNSVVRQLYSDYSDRTYWVLKCRRFYCLSFCRFCTLDADWFATPLLSAHHMLGQWTWTIVDERFGTLMTYKCIRLMPYFCHAEYTNLVWFVYILLAILRRNFFGFRHAFVVSSV